MFWFGGLKDPVKYMWSSFLHMEDRLQDFVHAKGLGEQASATGSDSSDVPNQEARIVPFQQRVHVERENR